jgi:hypothetical protein
MLQKAKVQIKRPRIFGLADKTNRIIEVDKKLRGREELSTFVHEGLHVAYKHMSEKNVVQGDKTITDILWRAGYRKKKHVS